MYMATLFELPAHNPDPLIDTECRDQARAASIATRISACLVAAGAIYGFSEAAVTDTDSVILAGAAGVMTILSTGLFYHAHNLRQWAQSPPR